VRRTPTLSLGRIHPRGGSAHGGFLAYRAVHAKGPAAAGVQFVTGDTKVVDRGKADGIFINTSDIGLVPAGVNINPTRAQAGDAILLSGAIAVHGIAVMSVREGLEFETEIASDTAALNSLVESMLGVSKDIHVLRDPTRGGVTRALTEIAQTAGVSMHLEEAHIPIHEEVNGACEILGLDPLYVANEGQLIAIVAAEMAEPIMKVIRAHPLGSDTAIIGQVTSGSPGVVTMKTRIGGTRIADVLSGEQLPRIC